MEDSYELSFGHTMIGVPCGHTKIKLDDLGLEFLFCFGGFLICFLFLPKQHILFHYGNGLSGLLKYSQPCIPDGSEIQPTTNQKYLKKFPKAPKSKM